MNKQVIKVIVGTQINYDKNIIKYIKNSTLLDIVEYNDYIIVGNLINFENGLSLTRFSESVCETRNKIINDLGIYSEPRLLILKGE